MIFQEGLRELKRKEFNLEIELLGLQHQPMVTISKEFWVAPEVELKELEKETNVVKRRYMEHRMMAEWVKGQAKINATMPHIKSTK